MARKFHIGVNGAVGHRRSPRQSRRVNESSDYRAGIPAERRLCAQAIVPSALVPGITEQPVLGDATGAAYLIAACESVAVLVRYRVLVRRQTVPGCVVH